MEEKEEEEENYCLNRSLKVQTRLVLLHAGTVGKAL